MAWVVDGSNVLGALRWNRESRESKERLASLCARFARAEGKRLILCFDGAPPSGFARKLGRLSVRFSETRSADEVIVEITRSTSEPWTVVSSDQGLASRVLRRTVEVLSAREFSGRIERMADQADDSEYGSTTQDDWDEYFSDPKNRMF